MLNALKDIKDIQYIRNVRITGFVRGATGMTEVDLEHEDIRRFVLPVNGRHDIQVQVK